ncbi:MAG: hypothetical protein CSA62_06965 [Planctomycetota bacterium]|nr:MAG: hypothetical protein CSA62_06965 [Planctomycetota bacterium]
MGAKGLVFYGILWGAFLAAPYQNLAFAMLVSGAALGVVALLSNARSLSKLRFVSLRTPNAPAGQARKLRLEINGARPLLGVSILLEGEEDTLKVPLPHDEARQLKLELPGQERGILRWQRIVFESRHPFGLFRSRRIFAEPGELVTPPSPYEVENDLRGQSLDDLLGTPIAEPGLGEPSSVRDFREGDDPLRLDWRATARRGDLVVKDREQLMRPGSEVVLDRRCGEGDLEDALSLIMSLARQRQANNETLTLGTQGSLATYGQDHQTWSQLERLLAELDCLPPEAQAPPANSPETLQLPAQRQEELRV